MEPAEDRAPNWEEAADPETLARAGYRICAHPGLVRYTVVHAVKEALEHLKREGSTIGYRDKMATTKEYFDAVDLERYLEMERDLLRPFSGADTQRLGRRPRHEPQARDAASDGNAAAGFGYNRPSLKPVIKEV